MKKRQSAFINAKIGFRALIVLDILLFGILGMRLLANMKEPPPEIHFEKPKLEVEVQRVKPENVQILISGYGEVQAQKTVNIAAEVAGKIIETHPDLEVGNMFKQGDILFKIDNRDYVSGYTEAKASVSQIANTLIRLNKEYEIAKERLQSLTRNMELARDDFEKNRDLYREQGIGTKSQVDTSERAYISAKDQLSQITQAVEIYPLSIREAGFSLEAAKARQFKASVALRRCSVIAPFDGRIKSVGLEVGQYVGPGQAVLTLVDDSTLEINVPIDSSDARKWLQFNSGSRADNISWFSRLKQVPVEINWTEDMQGNSWQGRLDRVLQYDKQTRTLTVAVKVRNRQNGIRNALPLVEGMFCMVTIPGKTLYQVYRLPRWAVSFKNTVYLAENNILKTIPVTVARVQEDEAFIQKGLDPGDNVIITRLVNPLENSGLKIVAQK